MEKKIQDMLYTASARLSHQEYTMREELNIKKRILNVFDYVKNHQNLLYDKKIMIFFKNTKVGKLTRKNLKEAEEVIKNYKEKNSNRIFAIIGKRECEIPYDEERKIAEYCNDLSLSLKYIQESLNSLKLLIEKDNQGEEILTLENIELFHAINLSNLDSEERKLLMGLYKKWAIQIDDEYKEFKQKQSEVQSVGLLLSTKDYKKGNYPEVYENSVLSNEIYENTNYIRGLIKMGEYDLVNSLIQDKKEIILVRIAYDIEGELEILEKEKPLSAIEVSLINEMKQELINEKEEILKMVGGAKKWQK